MSTVKLNKEIVRRRGGGEVSLGEDSNLILKYLTIGMLGKHWHEVSRCMAVGKIILTFKYSTTTRDRKLQ